MPLEVSHADPELSTSRCSVSGSDNDQTGGEDKPTQPSPPTPATPEPPATDSLFDSDWGPAAKPAGPQVFAPPPIPTFAPPAVKAPVAAPRTSEGAASVLLSGEIGKMEAPVVKTEEPAAK